MVVSFGFGCGCCDVLECVVVGVGLLVCFYCFVVLVVLVYDGGVGDVFV